jgi:hypothetical protein
LNRAPWAKEAAAIWDAHAAVRVCLQTLEIIPTDRAALEAAQARAGSDFEDNLQIASAVHAGADALVTRDPRGFTGSPIPVLSPADLCN